MPTRTMDASSYTFHDTIEVDGVTRSFYLRVPFGYDNGGEWPLVIALHGSGGNGRRMRAVWGSAGESAAIFCFPTGSDMGGEPHWATYTTHATGVDPEQDERFLLALKASLLERFRIRKTFLCGFSNGGRLTIQMQSRQPDFADGYGICSRGINHTYLEWPVSGKPTIVLIGDADAKDQWDGIQVNDSFGREALLSGPASRDWWAGRLGHSLSDFVETEEATDARENTITRDYHTQGAVPFRWLRVQEGGHHWFRPSMGGDTHASKEVLLFWRERAGL
jgi:poly(3-hydroxybutyrate) depolymerase